MVKQTWHVLLACIVLVMVFLHQSQKKKCRVVMMLQCLQLSNQKNCLSFFCAGQQQPGKWLCIATIIEIATSNKLRSHVAVNV